MIFCTQYEPGDWYERLHPNSDERSAIAEARQMLDTTYVCWFRNKRNTEKAKQEILKRFSEEPDDIHHWTEQDIYEQSRKIIACWDNA